MEEDEAKNMSLLALLSRGNARDDDALGVDHFSHHPARAVRPGGKHGVQSQLAGCDLLQISEENV